MTTIQIELPDATANAARDAGLLTPQALIEHVQAGTLAMVSSPTLLVELDEVIGRAKFDKILGRSNTSRERSLAEMRQLAEVIVPPPRRYASSSASFRVGDYFGTMREGHHAWINDISTNWSKACAE